MRFEILKSEQPKVISKIEDVLNSMKADELSEVPETKRDEISDLVNQKNEKIVKIEAGKESEDILLDNTEPLLEEVEKQTEKVEALKEVKIKVKKRPFKSRYVADPFRFGFWHKRTADTAKFKSIKENSLWKRIHSSK